jgi:hypothetical protein
MNNGVIEPQRRTEMKTTYFKSASTHGVRIFSVIVVAGMMAGCASGGSFSGIGGLDWCQLNPSEPMEGLDWCQLNPSEPGETVVLARDPASLAGGSQVERAIHDAVEFAGQKRFFEARNLLADVRVIQGRRSEGYQALSGAMALLALREGDIDAFRRIARQLDDSLGHPVRVDNAYVDVVGLYRAMSNRNLPVNASEPIKALKERLFATDSAQL